MTNPVECGNCAVQDGAELCLTCSVELARQLRGVPELVEQLYVSYAKQDRFGTGRRGKGEEAPLPVRFGIQRVIDRLGNEVTTWARDLVEFYELHDEPGPPRRRPHNTSKPGIPAVGAGNLRPGEVGRGRGLAVFPISSPGVDLACYAAEWLAEHVELLRGHPAALEAHQALTGVIAWAGLAADKPPAELFVGYCEACEGPLYAERRTGGTTCMRCGIYVTDVAERWDRALFKLRGYPATAADIAGWIADLYQVTLNRDTIRQWHHRGELTPVDWVLLAEGGKRKVPRFRIDAVLERARKDERGEAVSRRV